MITNNTLELGAEMREATYGLPLYNGGPGVDYTHSEIAYATNVTLLHDPYIQYDSATGIYSPSQDAEALIVQRGSGDGIIGSWGGVTGYIDTFSDPADSIHDDDFDPVTYTARLELWEECGLPMHEMKSIDMLKGQRFSEPRHNNNGVVHIFPVLGILAGQRPHIEVDGYELTGHKWIRLPDIKSTPNLSSDYLAETLPRALGSLGIQNPESLL